jgi:hypothetical protein
VELKARVKAFQIKNYTVTKLWSQIDINDSFYSIYFAMKTISLIPYILL